MDIETALTAHSALKGQVEQAKIIIEAYEKKIVEQDQQISVLESRVLEAQQNESQMRTIMTNNITESNAKINNYVENIQTLNATIVGLRAELDAGIDRLAD